MKNLNALSLGHVLCDANLGCSSDRSLVDFGVKNSGWFSKWAEHHLEITLPLTSLAKLIYNMLFTIVLQSCITEVPWKVPVSPLQVKFFFVLSSENAV